MSVSGTKHCYTIIWTSRVLRIVSSPVVPCWRWFFNCIFDSGIITSKTHSFLLKDLRTDNVYYILTKRKGWPKYLSLQQFGPGGRGGGKVLEFIFAWYVPLASQSPYPIIVYSVASCRRHLSHFWANMLFSRSQLSHFLFFMNWPIF